MSKPLHLALVGFANSGKSTFFNNLSGANQKTGNWTGVTVAVKQQTFQFNQQATLLSDLPGISSLTTRAQQGKDLSITQQFIAEQAIDCIINVVDATKLKRQLYLTTQILELGLPVVVVLNKFDRNEALGIDTKRLAKELGCQVFTANSLDKNTLANVEKKLSVLPQPAKRPANLIIPQDILIKLETNEQCQPKSLLSLELSSCNNSGCQQTDKDTLAIMQSRYEFIHQTIARAQHH